jgi:hypothetical protein
MAAARLAALLAVLGLSGCFFWDPWTPENPLPDPATAAPSRAVALVPGEPRSGSLDCKGGRCEQWFRFDAAQPGALRVEARIEGLGENAIARLFVQDAGGNTLGRAVSGEGLPLRVASAVDTGAHAVLLQVGGGPVVWQVEASFAP